MYRDEDIQKLLRTIFDNYLTQYWAKINEFITEKNVQGFPLWVSDPEAIVFYFGKNHIAVEYLNEGGIHRNKDQLKIEMHLLLDENDIVKHIIDIDYDGPTNITIPILGVVDNVFIPSQDADKHMSDAGWSIVAQMQHQSTLFAFNTSGFEFLEENWASLRNCFFYGIDGNSRLITRHISWMDVFPVEVTEELNGQSNVRINKWPSHEDLAYTAIQYEPPELSSSKLKKLVLLNRFIELYNTPGIWETTITEYLAKKENQFILKLAFGANNLQSEIQLDWQSEPNRNAIRPDFFVTYPNGYTDIIDFKLPNLKRNAIVGTENREKFSSEIESHISQVVNYQEYFEDPNNRQFVESNHNLMILNPKAWLVIGRRDELSGKMLRKLQARYKEIEIKTYDDIVDSVKGHVYLIVEN